ncbi:MAG: A/G-specific adenine glycosylase [Casimicrobiaceae bacterium]
MTRASFAARLVRWQRTHGRHDLPWQGTRDAYRIWLSEIMLQQTQVSTVLGYYARFLERFPNVQALAEASEDDVLAHWAGLGYYSRARNLHRAAQRVMAEHGGRFPTDAATLATLPGVGPSTAAAVAVFAAGERAAILDGNVKRVLARHAGIEGYPGQAAVARTLWALAEARLPASKSELPAYTQGLMDLGATVCTPRSPSCARCPVAEDCAARSTGRTASLPTPRPRRVQPERSQHFLLALAGRDVLLVKRPSTGVWGGLWCLPEIDGIDRALPEAQRHGRPIEPAVMRLTPIPHTFTHFRLVVMPVCVRLRCPKRLPPGALWLPLCEARTAAVPAPIRRLLAKLAEDSSFEQ